MRKFKGFYVIKAKSHPALVTRVTKMRPDAQ